LSGELDRKLRLRLIVVEDKIQLIAGDATGRIDLVLQCQQGILFALTDECRAAGKRQDDIDVVSSGGGCRRRKRYHERSSRSQSAAQISDRIHFSPRVLSMPDQIGRSALIAILFSASVLTQSLSGKDKSGNSRRSKNGAARYRRGFLA
jgi:hypothetical protein